MPDNIICDESGNRFKIIRPQNACDDELFAVSQLKLFLEKSTGYVFEIISEQNAEEFFNIFVGETQKNILKRANIKNDTIKYDGYVIQFENNNIFVFGNNSKGTINGVYGLLSELVDFECFADDEIYYKQTNFIKFKNKIIIDNPHFETRAPGFYKLNEDELFRKRTRTSSYKDDWGMWAHTHFKILPPEKYFKDHPDWYMVERYKPHLNGKQLCLSRDVGDLTKPSEKGSMRYEFVKNLKEIVKANPDKKYFMLGQQDVWTFCTCDTCRSVAEKYGGKKPECKFGGESAVMMRFINAVAREMKAWLDKEYPEREKVTFVTFAYHMTENPPVMEINGQFKPYDPSVIAEDNVAIMIAPIEACHMHTIKDGECNKNYRDVIKGWSAVSKNLFMWYYCILFTNYFYPFDNFLTIKKDYQYFRDNGVKFFFDMSAVDDTHTSAFADLRIYVQSKLMWNCDLDVNDLCNNFIEHYYKSASGQVKEYARLMYGNFRTIEKIRSKEGLPTHYKIYNHKEPYLFDKKYWSFTLLNSCLAQLDSAITIMECEKNEKVVNRLKLERLSPIFMLLQLYKEEYSVCEREKMYTEFISECKQFGLKRYRETWPPESSFIEDKIKEWRENLPELWEKLVK